MPALTFTIPSGVKLSRTCGAYANSGHPAESVHIFNTGFDHNGYPCDDPEDGRMYIAACSTDMYMLGIVAMEYAEGEFPGDFEVAIPKDVFAVMEAQGSITIERTEDGSIAITGMAECKSMHLRKQVMRITERREGTLAPTWGFDLGLFDKVFNNLIGKGVRARSQRRIEMITANDVFRPAGFTWDYPDSRDHRGFAIVMPNRK